MNLDNPGVLFSGLILGAIGMGMFIYGKKQQRLDCLAVGVALSVLPMVAHSLLVIWGVAGACLGGMYAKSRVG
ncbi:MAG: amino acid transport protein [Planctomycetota bacterium]|nr:amino acid transport protein [Planctomycetota bacterium]